MVALLTQWRKRLMNTPPADILKHIGTYGSDTGLKLVYNGLAKLSF